MFLIESDANVEMTDTDARQYGLSLMPKVNQSATAAFTANYIAVTDTASGAGPDYLASWDWGADASVEFLVTDAGDLTIAGTIKTEVATGAAPAEPHACDAAHAGVIVAVDDTNDTAFNEPCICLNLDGTGYDWRQLNAVTTTACAQF